ncbi:polymer-forming cytoskeletal protein [Rhodoferax sp.]|uniref:bactofilin family protein n=1 Tax=Rhodoferax sp. TaxID=50421 RepID=UPI002603FFEA|nr:polymer-forming cytoskeletal protein [Rhodoferax sp.]MDD2924725.1 polymer-forming cytoskeletal protein [Rhodoferax sp.]
MAMSPNFFNKREPQAPATRPVVPLPQAAGYGPSANAEALPAASPAQGGQATPAREGGSKLTVGPNIKLKGVEITDCDTLVVEGLVEATMDSRVMAIAEQGAFKGSAEIDIAEIRGQFDGDLTVRQKLVIYGTGKVSGKIRYGNLVIEEGGQLSGDIQFGALPIPRPASGEKPALAVAG